MQGKYIKMSWGLDCPLQVVRCTRQYHKIGKSRGRRKGQTGGQRGRLPKTAAMVPQPQSGELNLPHRPSRCLPCPAKWIVPVVDVTWSLIAAAGPWLSCVPHQPASSAPQFSLWSIFSLPGNRSLEEILIFSPLVLLEQRPTRPLSSVCLACCWQPWCRLEWNKLLSVVFGVRLLPSRIWAAHTRPDQATPRTPAPPSAFTPLFLQASLPRTSPPFPPTKI